MTSGKEGNRNDARPDILILDEVHKMRTNAKKAAKRVTKHGAKPIAAMSGQLIVCPHCCAPVHATDKSYQPAEGKPVYHFNCAVKLCMVRGFEDNPKMWGGHTYKEPTK